MFDYIEIKSGKRESAVDYLLNCLLRARINIHQESNKKVYDEDVNVYLANLLDKFMHPGYLTRLKEYICKYDTDIASKIEEHHDNIFTYYMYKNNADYYLLSLSIFGGLESAHVPLILRISNRNFSGRAKAYYSFASEWNRRIHHGDTAVSEILYKLSRRLQTYINILEYMKEEYFNMAKEFSKGEWFHIVKEANEKANEVLYKQKLDEYIKIYSRYSRSRLSEDRKKLVNLAGELQNYNPELKLITE